MTTTKTAAILPPLLARDFGGQVHDLLAATADWIGAHWLPVLIAFAVGALIVVALHALRRLGHRLCSDGRSCASRGSILGRAITRTTNFFIVMVAAKLVVGYAQAPVEVVRTVQFFFVIAAGLQAAIWVREVILGLVEHRSGSAYYRGETIANAMGIIRRLVTFAVFAIAVLVILSNLGVNVTGLVAGLGVGGIAIGLAAQGIFADLFAALAIIFDRPFSKGDVIGYDATSGTVEEIGLKSTRIRSITGEERIIANKNLLDKEIQNNTRRERRRIKFAIGTVYRTPPEVALVIPGKLKDVVEACGATFVRSGFVGFGDSSLNFQLEFDCGANFQEAYDMRHAIGIAILKRFNHDGIEFAYPTQTTFTSDPQGKAILPYPEARAAPRSDREETAG